MWEPGQIIVKPPYRHPIEILEVVEGGYVYKEFYAEETLRDGRENRFDSRSEPRDADDPLLTAVNPENPDAGGWRVTNRARPPMGFKPMHEMSDPEAFTLLQWARSRGGSNGPMPSEPSAPPDGQ